jgi:hypothetical protein
MTGTKRRRGGLLACALLVAAVLAGSTSITSPRAASKAAGIDVEIAIDTTGSMGYSIAQAQTDAKGLVKDIRARYSTARFAVVQFKDSYDTPEYQIMQPMTNNATAVDTAIDGLSASGGGDYPEAHNLVFQSAIDPANAIGWRAGARRILVDISDAEPHGAGTAGFKGCVDTSADPHGLSTSTTLASLKAAKVTLLMVRQGGTSASATLECYKSLAAAGYTGGAAKDGGDKLIDVIEAMIVKAINSTTASPVGTWRMGGRLYRWVAYKKGFEERSMTAHKLKHGCLVRKGDAVDRYYPKSGNIYRVAYRYWSAKRGGPGSSGKNCRKYWKAPKAKVRIVVTPTTMTLSCDNKVNKVCYVYKRVK